MAEIVRRRSWGGVLPLGRHVSISGSRSIHAPSVSIAPSSFQEEQNARHHKQFKLEQALTWPKANSAATAKPRSRNRRSRKQLRRLHPCQARHGGHPRPEGHRKEVGGLCSRLQMADRARLAWLLKALHNQLHNQEP